MQLQLFYYITLLGEFSLIFFDLFCRISASGTNKQAIFLLVCLKSREKKVDEIEFIESEKDHIKVSFKVLADWGNTMVVGETSFARLNIRKPGSRGRWSPILQKIKYCHHIWWFPIAWFIHVWLSWGHSILFISLTNRLIKNIHKWWPVKEGGGTAMNTSKTQG